MRTQVNIRLPNLHLTRLEAMRRSFDLTQSEMVMHMIDTQWAKGDSHGKRDSLMLTLPPARAAVSVDEMGRDELNALEQAIHIRRLDMAAAALRHYKMPVVMGVGEELFRYPMILAPGYYSNFSAEERQVIPPNVFADLGEIRHLIDFLENLDPAEAYRRWHITVTPVADRQAGWYEDYMTKADIDIEISRNEREYHSLYHGYGQSGPDAWRRLAELHQRNDELESMRKELSGPFGI